MIDKWEEVYGVSLVSYVDEHFAVTVNRMADIFCSPKWKNVNHSFSKICKHGPAPLLMAMLEDPTSFATDKIRTSWD